MLVGLFGGTFDPVHRGHIHAARSVMQAVGLSSLRWVLAARPGHRNPPQASLTQRWAMLQAMCATEPGFAADDTEIRAAGTSYTYNTLEMVRAQQPDAIPCWILGLDAFATLDSWYKWQHILDICNLLVVARPGQAVEMPSAVRQLVQERGAATLQAGSVGQIVRLDLEMLEISATDIRRRIAVGAGFEHLLIPPVSTYISQHNLYTENVA
ncbi:MAG: nicotinate-nucleotide adenylyltransferase [Pseudomonadota bacterium]